jgi:hypothetical protein
MHIHEIEEAEFGLLPLGTVTQFGTIQARSLTAYKIEDRWVPFSKVHGRPAAVTPLVTLGGWVTSPRWTGLAG